MLPQSGIMTESPISPGPWDRTFEGSVYQLKEVQGLTWSLNKVLPLSIWQLPALLSLGLLGSPFDFSRPKGMLTSSVPVAMTPRPGASGEWRLHDTHRKDSRDDGDNRQTSQGIRWPPQHTRNVRQILEMAL